LAHAALIPSECISRGELYGNNALTDLTAFDQTQELIDNLPVHYTPYEYSLCVDLDNNNKLVSFSITYANSDGSETYSLP
jgi:hypothetical protein